MPRYVAFLRAINLGATRKFPKDAISACARAVGGDDVATHINTGNLLLTSRRRSTSAVEKALEEAFAADRGFAVPTVAFTWAEYADLAAETDAWAPDGDRRHYVTLLKDAAPDDADARLAELSGKGESMRISQAVGRRAMHTTIDGTVLNASLGTRAIDRVIGVATTRDAKVIRAIAAKWA